MRVGRTLTLMAAALGTGSLLVFGQAPDASQVLAAAREALGGEKNLVAVKTFVATGRTRQLRGNNLVPIEFEINCELPDRFVRKDEIPAQDTDITVSGFAGDTLIQFPPPAFGRQPPQDEEMAEAVVVHPSIRHNSGSRPSSKTSLD
jgi:hypothetical protein